MVFNGEIYNYMELRRDLRRRASLRDHERHGGPAAALRAMGVACLRRLRGMFAFAIWDPRTQTLFAARDHSDISRSTTMRERPTAVRLRAQGDPPLRALGWALNTPRFAQFLTYGRTEEVPDDADTYLEACSRSWYCPAGTGSTKVLT